MFTKIWERYFIIQFLKVFFLFLFCFYGLYILIDYASHTSTLPQNTLQLKFKELFRYYTYVFASRAEILLPIALLIAFIKTVSDLNSHRELVALMASGFKLTTLMRPFILVALLFTVLLFLNEQYLLPTALKKLRRIEDATKHQRNKPGQPIAVKQVVLEDGSLLLFQKYDSAKEQFFDAFWIESIDSLYRIRNLAPAQGVSQPIPIGYFVDHLVRNEQGELLQQEAYQTFEFKNMRFNQKVLQSAIIDPEVLSLTELVARYRDVTDQLYDKESKLLTAFYWKLCLPWLCLLAVFIPAPLCVRYSRQFPLFFVYVVCLFGLLAFYMFIDAIQLVAKRQVISPIYALGVPFLTLFFISGIRFARMR